MIYFAFFPTRHKKKTRPTKDKSTIEEKIRKNEYTYS